MLLYILIALIVILVGWIVRLEVRINRLLAGKDGKSLEDSILSIKNGVNELHAARKAAESNIRDLRVRLQRSVQRVHTMRFNPFKGTGSGGNQSFVTAFADEDGNGVIVSGLYARENVSVYAKPIANFASEYNLSDEEKEVLMRIRG